MAQPPSQASQAATSAITEGARLSSMGVSSGGGGANAAKTGSIVGPNSMATGPDGGMLRGFLGSTYGHALISGVQAAASGLTTAINPTANGSLFGFALNKKVLNLGIFGRH